LFGLPEALSAELWNELRIGIKIGSSLRGYQADFYIVAVEDVFW